MRHKNDQTMSNAGGASNSDRRRERKGYGLPSVGGIAVSAAVMYGAYKVASSFWEDDEEIEEGEVQNDRTETRQASGASGGVSGGVREFMSSMLGVNSQPTAPRQNTRDLWKMKRKRYVKCKDEVTKAMANLFPSVIMKIEEATNTSMETKELKRIRANRSNQTNGKDEIHDSDRSKDRERELWETIKVQNMTRLVAMAFAHTNLFLVLTIQVYLFAGNVFKAQPRHTVEADQASSMDPSSHRLILAKTYDVFFESGIIMLTDTVRRAASRHLIDLDVMETSSMQITEEMLQSVIGKVQNEVLFGACARRQRRRKPKSPLRFFVSSYDDTDASEMEQGDNAVAQQLLNETWDLLESPVVEDAQLECFQRELEHTQRSWARSFMRKDETGEETSTAQPLATLLAQLKKTATAVYGKKDALTDFTNTMANLPTVVELNTISFD